MKNIVKFEIQRNVRSLFIWSSIVSLLIVLLMMFFPFLQNSSMQDIMKAKMDAMPESMKKSFDMELFTNLSSVTNYFASVYQNILMALCIFASMYGTNSLIKEEGEGTIELLYARPVTRGMIVRSKMLSHLIMLLLLVMVTTLVSVFACLIFSKNEPDLVGMVNTIKLMSLAGLVTSMVYMSLGFLISAIIKNPGHATGAFFGLFFITYIIGMLSKMVDKVSFLRFLSPYQYADPASILKSGYDPLYLVLSLVIIISACTTTFIAYSKKDLRV